MQHVKQRQKKFYTPQSDHPVIKILDEIEDPRKPSLTFGAKGNPMLVGLVVGACYVIDNI